MATQHVCPWWVGYLLASPLRRLIEGPPEKHLGAHVRTGMQVLEVGPGMGYHTLPMARLAGPAGHIVCVDVQQRMLRELERRARKADVAERIECRIVSSDSLGVEDLRASIDFVLLAAVVHEVPDQRRLFGQVRAVLKDDGKVLVVEPSGHVSRERFQATLRVAAQTGLHSQDEPRIPRCRAAVLRLNRNNA
jgi:ubiquinone/menaquinone biosynthesis C-methylase UbiE